MTHTANLQTSPNFNAREAEHNMIEQQIRTWEVLDPAVLDLLAAVPREDFVAESQTGLAFADIELPIGHGQTMLAPKLEGRILQALNVKKTDKVLLIGTGSGHLTALLAKAAAHVEAVEIHPELSDIAKTRLQKHNIQNVTLHVGDAFNGAIPVASYDVIVFTGSMPLRPTATEKMLTTGGRLFAVIGEMPIMQATLTQRAQAGMSDDALQHETIFETCLPQLINAPQPPKFNF